jgi:hypothetical protein
MADAYIAVLLGVALKPLRRWIAQIRWSGKAQRLSSGNAVRRFLRRGYAALTRAVTLPSRPFWRPLYVDFRINPERRDQG